MFTLTDIISILIVIAIRGAGRSRSRRAPRLLPQARRRDAACGGLSMSDTKPRDWVALTPDCVDARDIDFTVLPDSVVPCLSWGGNGKRRQHYREGTLTGRCELCEATGFVYHETVRAVPASVINQIAVANGVCVRHFPIYGNDWRRS